METRESLEKRVKELEAQVAAMGGARTGAMMRGVRRRPHPEVREALREYGLEGLCPAPRRYR